MRAALPLLFALPLLTACLASTYQIPASELDRLGQMPRQERGRALHAVQQLSIGETEVDTSRRFDAVDVAAVVARSAATRRHVRATTRRRGRRVTRQRSREQRRLRVQVAAAEADRVSGRPRVQVRGEQPIRIATTGSSGSGRSGRSGSSRGGNSSGSGGGAKKAGGAIVAIIAIAAVAAGAAIIALGASEGARYDGWVEVAPDHMLHLYQRPRQGPRLWIDVPVADVSPEVAAWADGAILDPGDGQVLELGRRPLDRVGGAFSVLGMASQVNVLGTEVLPDVADWGGGSRVSVGGFPIQYLGLMAALDIQGANALNTRIGGELQGFAPELGRASFGLYLEGGWVRSRRDRGEFTYVSNGGYYGGGMIFQAEVTTRLAFEMRGGLWGTEGRFFPTFGLGFTVY